MKDAHELAPSRTHPMPAASSQTPPGNCLLPLLLKCPPCHPCQVPPTPPPGVLVVELHGADVVQVAQQRKQAPAGHSKRGIVEGGWAAVEGRLPRTAESTHAPRLPQTAVPATAAQSPGCCRSPALLVVPHLDLVIVAARHKQRLRGVEVHAAHGACRARWKRASEDGGRWELPRSRVYAHGTLLHPALLLCVSCCQHITVQPLPPRSRRYPCRSSCSHPPSCSSKRSISVPMR